MSEQLLAIEQHEGHDAGIPWVLEEGRRIQGQDGASRTSELRRGIASHDRVRIERADTSDAEVESMLARLHDADYLRALRSIPPGPPTLRADLAPPGMSPDMPVSAEAVAASFEGVRTAMTAATRTLAGARLTYAISRPPGHHAGPDWLAGYCYLNTTAAAAKTLCDRAGGRVGIIDLDIHYPNGTSALVAGSDTYELHSLHAWPVTNVPELTVTPSTSHEHVVEFRGPPTVETYLGEVSRSLMQLVGSVDALVVSMGYDTVQGDPHGSWTFEPSIFGSIGRLLRATGLPICVVQEGGYAHSVLAQCSHEFTGGLLHEGGT